MQTWLLPGICLRLRKSSIRLSVKSDWLKSKSRSPTRMVSSRMSRKRTSLWEFSSWPSTYSVKQPLVWKIMRDMISLNLGLIRISLYFSNLWMTRPLMIQCLEGRRGMTIIIFLNKAFILRDILVACTKGEKIDENKVLK